MINQLNSQDYENLANEILEMKNSNSEEQLLENLGARLLTSDLVVTDDGAETILVSSLWDERAKQFNFNKALYSPLMLENVDKADFFLKFKKTGKKLMKRIKKAICESKVLKDLFTDSDKLDEKLKALIPIILSVITASVTLGPTGLAIAVIIIAYLLKVGYEAYCPIA